jgi:hypothetical protein
MNFRPRMLLAIALIFGGLSAAAALANEAEQIVAQELEKTVLAGVSGVAAAVRIGDRII